MLKFSSNFSKEVAWECIHQIWIKISSGLTEYIWLSVVSWIVSGCSPLKYFCLACKTWILRSSSSLCFLRSLNVDARSAVAKIVSGCSSPRILFLACKTWIFSFSASVYLPRSLYVDAILVEFQAVCLHLCPSHPNSKCLSPEVGNWATPSHKK